MRHQILTALAAASLGLAACTGLSTLPGAPGGTPASEAAKIIEALDRFDQRCAKTVHFTAAIGAGAGGAIAVDKTCPAVREDAPAPVTP